MLPVTQKIVEKCFEAAKSGYQIQQGRFGVEAEPGEVYDAPNKCLCALGAVLLNQTCISGYEYADAMRVLGASADFVEGFAFGFDDNTEDMLGPHSAKATFVEGRQEGQAAIKYLRASSLTVLSEPDDE